MSRSIAEILRWALIAAPVCMLQCGAFGEPVAAHYPEGTEHGFLALTTQDGQTLAVGDLFQVVRGDRVTSHLVFNFKDGSVDDETTIFSQHGNFRLISDHHIQKGPFFPHPIDLSIDVPSGKVTVRSVDKDGKQEVTTDHLNLPPDLYNGLVNAIVKNVRSDTPETKVSMLVATPKPRLVTLSISPRGTENYVLAGSQRKALGYEIKIELGAIAGAVAQFIGKQPPPIQLEIVGGQVPTFLREEGQLFEGSAILTMKLVSPVWPSTSLPESHK